MFHLEAEEQERSGTRDLMKLSRALSDELLSNGRLSNASLAALLAITRHIEFYEPDCLYEFLAHLWASDFEAPEGFPESFMAELVDCFPQQGSSNQQLVLGDGLAHLIRDQIQFDCIHSRLVERELNIASAMFRDSWKMLRRGSEPLR